MGQRITIIAGDVGTPGGGQSRFVINLALGLARQGAEVGVAAASARLATAKMLAAAGIRVRSLAWTPGTATFQFRTLTSSPRLGRGLAALAQNGSASEWYVVVSDEAIGVVEFLSSGRTAYISNGDFSVLFLNPRFYLRHSAVRKALSTMMAFQIRRNGNRARKFNLLLANSEFTRKFMSFLYGVPFSGVVHPPVDTDLFCPERRAASAPYALAVMRNEAEYGTGVLTRIARKIPLRVAGGAKVPGAEALGLLSDAELATLYASAQFLVSPSPAEFFGYAVVESLASGTPVLALNCGGPAELVEDGQTGWLMSDEDSLSRKAIQLAESGYPDEIRGRACHAASRFSIDSVARGLLKQLSENAASDRHVKGH